MGSWWRERRARIVRGERRRDDGFTLAEVLVSVAIISVVMLAVASVFVATAGGTTAQGLRQAADRLLTDGFEQAHALADRGVVTGRDLASSTAQWNAPAPSGVRALLGTMTMAYDPAPTPDTRAVALSTSATGRPTTVDRQTYQQYWYVATCYVSAATGCQATSGTGAVAMYDVVVAVTWRSKACANQSCSLVGSTLIAVPALDPVFNSKTTAVAPTVSQIASKVNDMTQTVSIPIVATGNGNLTIVAAGLPAGVSVSGATITGTLSPVPAPVTSTVTVTVGDQLGQSASTQFTWTVNPLPTVAAQTVPLVQGAVVNAVNLVATGGSGPFTWTATSALPAGLTLSPAGAVTGTLSALATTGTTTVKVTDSAGLTATGTVTWSITAPLSITPIAPQSTWWMSWTSLTPVAVGGAGGNTWTATGLPGGLRLCSASTGVICGQVTGDGGLYNPVLRVTDSRGTSVSVTFGWRVL